ncbi:tRNA-guanine transglycosylase DpdA [Thalassotalea ponticola]|uniref:tRNA-guanine transglycosylase DpdA n=1 Tax=Thalassotalea ponticola TaxID=1523392 RepID=UPI0025B4DC00|nr:tRNA-guanine transglycosylase DpdA [Thalassotalea ponticola]MDN3652333.1 tRNA-guanine transglycosylase DpdA [Thalassotalea ponticola]
MKFFFPDSHDYVDPTFDFETEKNNEHRVIQRDDKYAHELFSKPVYDGILVSKAIVDGVSGVKGRYSVAQRQRFFREGIYRFFRLPKTYLTMGDCGAFSYAKEHEPIYTVDEVNEFYSNAGFTYGISLDHIIFDFETAKKKVEGDQLEECLRRQEITLEKAEEFLIKNKGLNFGAYGVAHGWNPESYADSVIKLQKMGYKRIAIGGMIPLKSPEILKVLKCVNDIRKPDTQFHLLGINRLEHIAEFANYGVTSFDSTSPLMKGLKDDKKNYHTSTEDYTAIGVPQVDANNNMRKLVASGAINQNEAFKLEKACLESLIGFDSGKVAKEDVLSILTEYEKLYNPKASRVELMDKVLTDKPWKKCPCDICTDIGIHVVLKRAAARNRRRGFHNLYIAYEKLQLELKKINQVK